jgi:hypothetical protein
MLPTPHPSAVSPLPGCSSLHLRSRPRQAKAVPPDAPLLQVCRRLHEVATSDELWAHALPASAQTDRQGERASPAGCGPHACAEELREAAGSGAAHAAAAAAGGVLVLRRCVPLPLSSERRRPPLAVACRGTTRAHLGFAFGVCVWRTRTRWPVSPVGLSVSLSVICLSDLLPPGCCWVLSQLPISLALACLPACLSSCPCFCFVQYTAGTL